MLQYDLVSDVQFNSVESSQPLPYNTYGVKRRATAVLKIELLNYIGSSKTYNNYANTRNT